MNNNSIAPVSDAHTVMNREPCRYFSLVMLLASVLLLSACSPPKVQLSDAHVRKIKSAYVDREFVFLTDWHSGMVVHKGQPMNNLIATFYNKTPQVARQSPKRGPLVARGGDVASIINVTPLDNHRLYFTFKASNGKTGDILLLSPNKDSWGTEFYEDMTDEMATITWVNDQLTRATIKFLDVDNKPVNQVAGGMSSPGKTALPEPLPEISLTPVATVAPPVARAPSITDLNIQASPADVRNDGALRLNLDFTVDTANRDSVPVTETRTLLLEGEVLPGYPKTDTQTRGSGHHVSSFEQRIPPRARAGSYLYRGEVCIADVCSRQETGFRVVP